jgi:hypothetical protein
MRILLLHPEDEFPASSRAQAWDLIVDLGLAPAATYEAWSQQAGCRVVSISGFAHGFDDLYSLKEMLQQGTGWVVDEQGIDWWDVVLPMLLPDLERMVMLSRLAGELDSACQISCSRPDCRAVALQRFLGVSSLLPATRSSRLAQKIRHYRKAFSRLDFDQLSQIAQDKLDPEHALRRRLARKKSGGGRPVFLLPTAYINVSRTAVSYAAMLPEEEFLLVVARPGGRLGSLPKNVRMISLDSYFGPQDRKEMALLLEKWASLQRRLVVDMPELRLADALGMFQRIPSLMRWGVAARDAWKRLFASENVAGCLSADDANPYTSVPLYLAVQRGIPALAVHHGALDYRMAVKPLRADVYLAKGEMERDYLLRKCRMPPERIVNASPAAADPGTFGPGKSWLVFFTEPYLTSGWREDEIYRALLPGLRSLAEACGLRLIFKLHPFESVKGQWNLLRKFLSADQLREIEVLAGPISPELWAKTRCAITFSSSVALECDTRGIPIFLCGWMQSAYGGYLQQYAKFGIGHILDSPAQLLGVPELLANWRRLQAKDGARTWRTIEPSELRAWLTGNHPSSPQDLASTKTAS